MFRKKLREGDLDDKEIEISVAEGMGGVEIMAPPGLEEMTSQLQNLFSSARAMRAATCGLRASSAITCSAQNAWPLPSAAYS